MHNVLQESAEDDDADDGEGMMAAYGCMRALSTVLDSVSGMSPLFPELEAILFPLMQRLASTEGQDVFEEVLELISYFTYFSPAVRAQLPVDGLCPASAHAAPEAPQRSGPDCGHAIAHRQLHLPLACNAVSAFPDLCHIC